MVQTPGNKQSDYLYSLADQGRYVELIEYACKHERASVRYGAAGILAESTQAVARNATAEARQLLIEAVLADPTDGVRAHIVEVLRSIDESIVDTIISRLEANPQATPTEQPYPWILTTWHSSQYPPLRYLAVAGYGQVGTQTAITHLKTSINEEDDVRVLCRAIEEVGKIGDETCVSPIQRHLRAESDAYSASTGDSDISDIKHTAIEALVEIGSDAAYEALVTATRSQDETLRQHAISEIGRFGAKETVDTIVDELNEDVDESVREEAAEGVITSFREAEFDEGDSIRQRAIEELGKDISTEVSREFVSIINESPRKSEQRNAAWLLGQVKATNEFSMNCLVSRLNDEDDYLQQIAAASLAKLDPEEVESKIDSILESTDEDSDLYQMASFVKSSLRDEAEEAKKEMVDYSYVEDPSDYTTSR